MNRWIWIVAATLILIGFGTVYINRTAHSDMIPYLGRWKGGFVVKNSLSGKEPPTEYRRSNLEGFVQVYATGRKFKMYLQGEQQEINLDGTWTILRPGRISLRFSGIKIDDFGGDLNRDPNKKYIPNEQIRDYYSKPLILDVSGDKKHLNGLLSSIGDFTGEHTFVKDSP